MDHWSWSPRRSKGRPTGGFLTRCIYPCSVLSVLEVVHTLIFPHHQGLYTFTQRAVHHEYDESGRPIPRAVAGLPTNIICTSHGSPAHRILCKWQLAGRCAPRVSRVGDVRDHFLDNLFSCTAHTALSLCLFWHWALGIHTFVLGLSSGFSMS